MTPKEYGQLAEWFAEGRAEGMRHYKTWTTVRSLPEYAQIQDVPMMFYRRRQDVPTMPDEVWVCTEGNVEHYAYFTAFKSKKYAAIRYIRADAVIPGERLEFRYMDRNQWLPCDNREYRFKEDK